MNGGPRPLAFRQAPQVERRISRTALKDASGQPVAEEWLVEGGGHAWFGGDPRGSYTQTVGLDASRVMVRFFLAE